MDTAEALYYNSIIFTDYDTVKGNFFKEMTTKDFFNFLEKGIKTKTITNCYYNYDTKQISFFHGMEQYNIIVNDDIKNTTIILTLFDYEKEIRKNEIEEKMANERKEKILEECENGIIKNEKDKELYLNELRKKLNLIFLNF